MALLPFHVGAAASTLHVRVGTELLKQLAFLRSPGPS